MAEILIEPQFLPPIEYFTRILKSDKVWFDVHHHYQKQTYRNRCYIRSANKVERLTVPVKAKNHTPFKDVTIDYSVDWVKLLWRALQSSYANAPFYIFYADRFKNIFLKKPQKLLNLNIELLTLCLELLNIPTEVCLTERFQLSTKDCVDDLRSQITPKQKYSTRPFYRPEEYMQVFGSNFEENLSILDLIFCEGPNAISVVTNSTR